MTKYLFTMILCVLLGIAATAQAQQRRGGRGETGDSPPRRDFGGSLPAAGLTVQFANGAACAPIASGYGSPTRFDGSKRQTGGVDGEFHGGIDLSLKIGTPLLAIAPGIVYSAGSGGLLEGNYIWLMHRPSDTGLPFLFLTKYQHLDEVPRLEPGRQVALGEEIARSGRTGTIGPYFGPQGYPHLHLSVRVPLEPRTELSEEDRAAGLNASTLLVDPLAVFVPGIADVKTIDALAPAAKVLTVAYVDAAGAIAPADAKLVWPVACS